MKLKQYVRRFCEIAPELAQITPAIGAALVAASMLSAAPLAFATSGRTDENGCHNSKPVGWHCHDPSGSDARYGPLPDDLAPTQATPEDMRSESQPDRERRMKLACWGRYNEGACLGYGSQ